MGTLFWNMLFLLAPLQASSDESCIGEQAGYPTCSFSIAILEGPGSGQLTLQSRQKDGMEGTHALWKELASLSVTLDRTRRVFNHATCEFKGKADDTVVAATAKFGQDDPELIPAVDWAYRIDLPSGKFVAIDPRDVKCANTDIGAD